jgi:cysteine desulfurase
MDGSDRLPEESTPILLSAAAVRGSKTILIHSTIEHSSVRKTVRRLVGEGVKVLTIPVDDYGTLNLTKLAQSLTADVFLVSVMLANNETGFVLPVKEIAALTRAKGIPLHTDAVCAVGKIPIDFKGLGCDFLSFSSHKFGGLKGTGGILYKAGSQLVPQLTGGPHEGERRAGTENVLGILAAGQALGVAVDGLMAEMRRQEDLRERLQGALPQVHPNVRVITSETHLPQTLSVAFPGASGAVLISKLDLAGVAVSHGSACASGALETSQVLLAMGLAEEVAASTIRLSFGRGTRVADIDELLLRLKNVLEGLTA